MAARTTKRARSKPPKETERPEVASAVVETPVEPKVSAAPRNPANEDETIQALTLFLDESEYAIPILRVREIASYGSVTPVPTTPEWIRGVMNLRGTVVPVVDLRAKLGLGRATLTRRTCLVIVELELDDETIVMAVVVDGVNRVIDLSPEDIQEPPAFGTRVEVAFLGGLIHVDERLVLLLDLNRVLSAIDVRDLRQDDIQRSAHAAVQEA